MACHCECGFIDGGLWHAIHEHPAKVNGRGFGQSLSQLNRFGHWHLFRGDHGQHGGHLRVVQQVAHPLGLVGDDADSHQGGQCIRGRHLGDEMPTGFRVDDHHVVVVLANLVAQFADRQYFFHCWRSICNEVEDSREWGEAADYRQPQK